MSQRYRDNTKRPNRKENQLGILRMYAFCQKIQQTALDPGESAAGVKYQSMSIHSKKWPARNLKNVRILPENSADGLRSRRECCWS